MDLRTREGREQEVLEHVKDYGGFTIWWITEFQTRAYAGTRLVESGKLRVPKSGKGEYPYCRWEITPDK